MEEFLNRIDFDTLKEKFIKCFELDDYALGVMSEVEDKILKLMMIDKFIDEFSEDEIRKLFDEE